MTDPSSGEPHAQPINLLLFRVALLNPPQTVLFGPGELTDENRPTILAAMVREKLSMVHGGRTWSIGNFREVGEWLQFRIGRDVTHRIIKRTDEGDFVDEEETAAGASDVLLQPDLGLVAISPPTDIGTPIESLGRRLADVLETHPEMRRREATVRVTLLSDPDDFIDTLRQAAEILSVSIDIAPPNPTDIDKDFTEPLEGMTRRSGASSATFSLRGGDIDPDEIEPAVRTASARGNDVRATIRDEPDGKTRTIHNWTTNVPVSATHEELEKDPSSIFERIVATYTQIITKLRAQKKTDEGEPGDVAPPQTRKSRKRRNQRKHPHAK